MKTPLLLLVAAFCATVTVTSASDLVKCERTYQNIGCFEEYNPQNLLLNERFNVRWGNIEAFIQHLTCLCGAKAREENKRRSADNVFKGFALHYWGVCYGKTKADLDGLKFKSESHKCTGSQEYNGCRKEHSHCVGHGYADYVYKLVENSTEANIDGGYSDWEAWTPCKGECGTGIKLRERTCTKPEPKGKGKDCSELGPNTEREACETGIPCPVDGGFSAWAAFGPCSQTCGGGNQTRSRRCDNPAPAHGGKNCEGALNEVKPCKNDLCPGSDGISKAQDLVRDFLIGFHNTSYPDKKPSGKFHQAILAIQRAVANEFALGTTGKNLQERLDDLKDFLKVATAGGSIDFARATLGKGLYVFMKKKIEEGLPIDKLNEASNGYLDSIKREIGDDKFGQLMLVDGAASLIFTVDTTGSMRDEINAAKGIANSIINMERKFPVDYVLSPFNDPAVGPVTHKNESNKQEFISAIQGLRVSGGGDCPEMAFGGMIEAYDANPKLGSPMFVFTDAGAKDDTFEMKEGLKTLADQYSTTINFFTNYRGCGDAKAIKSYQEIAAYTSGQIFPLQSHSEISKFTSFVKSSLKGGTTIAKNTYTTSRRRSAATEGYFFVDEDIETLLISLNVKNANTAQSVKLFDSTGKAYSAQSTTAYSQVYSVDNPLPGKWHLQFPSGAGERSFIAKAIAKETVDFVPYFVHQEKEGSPVLSVSHPLQGGEVTLMVQLSGNGLVDHKSLVTAITNENGQVLSADIALKSIGGSAGIFQAKINPPAGKFKFLLKGQTKKGSKFQRMSQASFEATDTVLATISAGNEFTASASKGSIRVNLYIYNKGSSQNYRFVATSSHGSISADSSLLMVSGGKNSTASFTFNLPSNARSLVGKTTNVAITATGQSSSKKVQAAFALLFVP